MMKNLTSSPDFLIRSPETAEEIEHYFRLNAETFRPDEDTVLVASRRRRFIEDDPDFQLTQLRSAFYRKTYVGSYHVQERWLCVESSRLRIGCIGGVVTDQDYRHQEVATAMMRDAIAFAQNRQYSLLLLHGIPDYYHQRGFIDVIEDMPQHAFGRVLIPDQPSDQPFVRVAELSDAAHLLVLYVEYNRASMCTFAPTRTTELQVHYLKNWPEDHMPLLAFNKRRGALLNSHNLECARWIVSPKRSKKRDSASKFSRNLCLVFVLFPGQQYKWVSTFLMNLSLSSMCSFHINRAELLGQTISDELPESF